MQFDNKTTRSVADAVAQIMSEALKGDQHKIDKNKNNKIDSEDLKMLRKEESEEQVQEGWDDMLADVKKRNGPQPSGGSGVKQGTRYGGGKQKDTPEQDEDKPKAKKKAKGAFSEMLNTYQEGGLKTIAEAWAKKKKVMKEEPDNAQFTAELEKQKKKAAGTATDAEKAKVAAPASQGCVEVKEEAEQLDELKRSTLSSYVKKASRDNSNRSFDHGDDEHRQYGMGDDDEEDARVDREEKKIETRQKGIDRAATRLAKEEVQQIDELSKTTLGNYYNAAKQDNKDHADSRRSGDKDEAKWAKDRMVKRSTGMGAAKNRLNKEEVEELDERALTASETEKKEDIVKGMKKSMAGFKERYGDRAKSVMYATATKNAKGE